MGDEYIEVVKYWEIFINVKEVEWFLGFVNYYRGFIVGFVQMVYLLYNIIGKKFFVWGFEQQIVFEYFWRVFILFLVLVLFIVNDQFVLDIDVFVEVIGVELC